METEKTHTHIPDAATVHTVRECKLRDLISSQIDHIESLEWYPHVSKIEELRNFLREKACEHDVGKIYTNDNGAVALICADSVIDPHYDIRILKSGYVVVVRYKNRGHNIFAFEPAEYNRFFEEIKR